MTFPDCHAFIPARYASTRFPGKPLADILGRPMFWHVWSRASRCANLKSVTLCTDDARIAEAAEKLGVPLAMTRPDHASGTDRVCEAARAMRLPPDAVVVNIQGDEPALDPAMLDELTAPFADPAVEAATLAHPAGREDAASFDRVKVVRDAKGDALYFSRAMIPHDREAAAGSLPYLVHVGLYAFRMRTLERYTQLPPSPLENREKLEQLRLLENGSPMRVSLTGHGSHGVDSPEDLERLLPLMRGML